MGPGKWSTTGHGGRNEITFTRIDGVILDGMIHGQGLLGWQPQVGLLEGISTLIAWYNQERAWASQINTD